MSDLIRTSPNDFTSTGDDVETGFKNDDTDLKNIYNHLTKLRNKYRGDTPPQSPNIGDVWVDSSGEEDVEKNWSGTAWVVNNMQLAINEMTSSISAMALTKVSYFNTLQDLTSTNIPLNTVCKTLGYYSVGDGGAATYKIVDAESGFCETTTGSKYAKLIYSGSKILAEQLGFKANDDTFNNHIVFEKWIVKDVPYTTVKFGSGKYYWSETCLTKNRDKLKIEGFDCGIFNRYAMGTIFVPFNSNQEYIIKLGGFTDSAVIDYAVHPGWESEIFSLGHVVDKIAFSDDEKPVTKFMLMVQYCQNTYLDVSFRGSTSKCLEFRNTWECDVKSIDISDCSLSDRDDAYIVYADVLADGASNNSRIYIDNLNFESSIGRLIKTELGSNVVNCMINVMSVERSNSSGTIVGSKAVYDTCSKIGLLQFLGPTNGLTINQMNIESLGDKYFTYNAANYVDSLFEVADRRVNISVGLISFSDCGSWMCLLSGTSIGNSIYSTLNIGSINAGLSRYGAVNFAPGTYAPQDLYYDTTYVAVSIGKTNMVINRLPNGAIPLDAGVYNDNIFRYSNNKLIQTQPFKIIDRDCVLIASTGMATDYLSLRDAKKITFVFYFALSSTTENNNLQLVYSHGGVETAILMPKGYTGNYSSITIDLSAITYDYFYVKKNNAGGDHFYLNKIIVE